MTLLDLLTNRKDEPGDTRSMEERVDEEIHGRVTPPEYRFPEQEARSSPETLQQLQIDRMNPTKLEGSVYHPFAIKEMPGSNVTIEDEDYANLRAKVINLSWKLGFVDVANQMHEELEVLLLLTMGRDGFLTKQQTTSTQNIVKSVKEERPQSGILKR